MNFKSNGIKYVLIFVCIAMVVAGASIFGVIKNDGDLKEKIVIELSGETTKTLKTELSGFYPGSEKEYCILMQGVSASSYLITLVFKNDEEVGGLENYIAVKIIAGEKTVEKPLTELLEGSPIELGAHSNELKIVYAMPENVGNEAQGTQATFYIELSAKNC